MRRLTFLCGALIALVTACTGVDGADGDDGANGATGLVAVSDEPAGEHCADGGQRIDVGLDDDGDGTLDAEEIDATSYVCNGGGGATSLVETSDEPPGANCAEGGQQIDVGIDDDGDGVLDPEEIDDTTYICDGATGGDGADSLLAVNDEPAGANCAEGGQRIDHGVDDDGDGVLDPDEIDGTSYVCDGADGVASLIAVTDEPDGANCQDGGHRIDHGLDDDGDGVLDPGEIEGTVYVCDGVSVHGYQLFTTSGTFVPPTGITEVRVLVVGGGGGGPGSHYTAGGSGHVRVGTFVVSEPVAVTVGAGGAGGAPGNLNPGFNGEASSFGAYLTAAGGIRGWYPFDGGGGFGDPNAGNGGSGGGGAGNFGCGGDGGTAGGDGSPGCSYPGGHGGNFDALTGFERVELAPGAGGAAGTSSNAGGGGGGGVLVDGAGGPGGDGGQSWSGKGGAGFGGGGGAGGFEGSLSSYATGGAGAGGVVYVEW